MMKQPLQLIFAATNRPLLQATTTFDELGQVNWQQVSCLLLDAADITAAYAALVKLRQNSLPHCYLRPVVFVANTENRSGWQWHSADAVLVEQGDHLLDSALVPDNLETINRWIDNLPPQERGADGYLQVKVLRLLASRQATAEPQATPTNYNGYVYPLLQPVFSMQDMGTMQMLGFLEQQNLLSATLFDRAHFCIHCDSAFLNFKETCVACGSHDLDVVELVHHFNCGFTADITRFKTGGDALICPKCDKHLRHIGVDYDKPSTVNKCRVCQHVSQDGNVVAKCFNCNCSTEAKFLDLRRINSYQLTSVGLNAAFYGLQTYFTDILENELQLLSLREFELFANVEAARIARYGKSQSALAIVRFVGLDKIHIELGSKAKQIFTELAGIFKTILRETDIITAYNESMFAILMPETSQNNAELALSRLQKAVEQLFTENFDRSLEIQQHALAVTSELQVRDALERFLNQ